MFWMDVGTNKQLLWCKIYILFLYPADQKQIETFVRHALYTKLICIDCKRDGGDSPALVSSRFGAIMTMLRLCCCVAVWCRWIGYLWHEFVRCGNVCIYICDGELVGATVQICAAHPIAEKSILYNEVRCGRVKFPPRFITHFKIILGHIWLFC